MAEKIKHFKHPEYCIKYKALIQELKDILYFKAIPKYGYHLKDSTLQGCFEHLAEEFVEVEELLKNIDPDSFDFLVDEEQVTKVSYEMIHVLQCAELFLDLLLHKKCKAIQWQKEGKRGILIERDSSLQNGES
ncbi:MAG: hypothetical protein ACW98X_17815 [Promethearchaeota archaeon]|jgi:hypothetical protein